MPHLRTERGREWLKGAGMVNEGVSLDDLAANGLNYTKSDGGPGARRRIVEAYRVRDETRSSTYFCGAAAGALFPVTEKKKTENENAFQEVSATAETTIEMTASNRTFNACNRAILFRRRQ